jgi:hypothetical protein
VCQLNLSLGDHMETTQNEPKGIGGWLIPPALALIFTPFLSGYQFYQDMLPVFKSEVWNALTTSGSAAYHPLWRSVIIIEVISNLILIIFTFWLLWLFFNKSNRTPKLFIVWLIMFPAIQIIDLLLTNQIPVVAADPIDPETIKNLVRSIVAAAIWIPYFLISKRVKNTFVETDIW